MKMHEHAWGGGGGWMALQIVNKLFPMQLSEILRGKQYAHVSVIISFENKISACHYFSKYVQKYKKVDKTLKSVSSTRENIIIQSSIGTKW